MTNTTDIADTTAITEITAIPAIPDTRAITDTDVTTAPNGTTVTAAPDAAAAPGAGGAPGGPQLPDPRPLFRRAGDLASSVVAEVRADQLDARTPCDEFTVYELVDHMWMALRRIGAIGAGWDAFGPTSELPSGLAFDDLKVSLNEKIETAESTWSDAALLSPLFELPWATMPGAAVLTLYVSEITVHTWDLATTLGLAVEFDDAVTGAALGLMRMALPANGRNAMLAPFHDAVPTAADAPLIDQLVAWTGRDPLVAL